MKKVSEMGHEKRSVAKHFCFCGKAMIPVVCAICDGCGDDPYGDPLDKYVCGLCDGTGETWRCPDGHTEEIKDHPVVITWGDRRIIVKQLDTVLSVSLDDVQMPDGYNCVWIPIHSTDRKADMQFAFRSLMEEEVALEIERKSQQKDGAVLCYVDRNHLGGIAYFTTRELSKQNGHEWSILDYAENAGGPYRWDATRDKDHEAWEIHEVRFLSDALTPAEWASEFHGNVHMFSVNGLNRGVFPWLVGHGVPAIYAGTTVAEFKRIIKASGGTIFVEEK